MISKFFNFFFLSFFNFLKFKKLPEERKDIIFYSENESQWDFFEGIIRHLCIKKNCNVCYVTSSKKELTIDRKIRNLKIFYIGSSFIRIIFFAVLKTRIIIMSLPDLAKYEIKRSKYDVKYIFVPHNILSTHMVFRKGAFDAFDVFFCSGPYHYKEIRESENKYKTKRKKLLKFGYSRLDKIIARDCSKKNNLNNDNKIKILIAPSWGKNGLFETGAIKLVEILRKNDYQVTLRPHPDTIKYNQKCIRNLLENFKSDKKVIYSPTISSIESYFENDLMISDWSGSAFEFAFGTLKPVIFIDLPKKVNNKQYVYFKSKPIEIELRKKIGKVVKLNKLDQIKFTIESLLKKKVYWRKKISNVRGKNLYNLKKSGISGGEYIFQYLKNLKK